MRFNVFKSVRSSAIALACTSAIACGAILYTAGKADASDRRVAFVVGNGDYKAVAQLPNPRSDAESVAAALRKSGFEVITAVNLDRIGFDSAMQQFVRSMHGADLSVFYYSGHGLQVDGENRLVPIDAELKSPSDLEVETVSVKTVMSYMKSNSKVQLVYLDSCRTNPFPATSYLVGAEQKVASPGVGLAPQEAALGSLTAFSTQPDSIALDGTGETSPFTTSVLAHSFKLGVDVKAALESVTDEVFEATARRQKPWLSEALVKPVFLSRPVIKIVPVDTAVAATEPTVKIGAAPSQDKDVSNAPAQAPAPQQNQFAAILSDAFAQPRRFPVGVGQLAMLDSATIVTRSTLPAIIEFVSVPKAGVLYLDGKPLGEGDLIDEDSLRKVTFEPAVAATDAAQEVSLKVAERNRSAPVVVTGELQPFVVGCDAEAGEPLDLQGVSRGKVPTDINPETALAACTEAVQQFPNIARYKFELGRAKLASNDKAGAIELFRQAADAGYARASSQLGVLAQQGGEGKAANAPEANKLLKLASDQGDPFAMMAYGRNLIMGEGVDKNVELGTLLMNRSVEMGDTEAMNTLGSMYYYGRGLKINPVRGMRYYKAALVREDLTAMNNVGLACLQGGGGVTKDVQKALALFKKASIGGHPKAATELGSVYFNGTGVPKDWAAAAQWYEIGADRGDAWAAAKLAFIYSKGPANLRDMDKAVRNAALAIALDKYNEAPKNKDVLKALPAEAKQKLIKAWVAELGTDNAKTGADLDETLVLLAREVWRSHNPLIGQF